MYAVIRAGGKQYRVSPGDVIHIEKVTPTEGRIEFNDVLAVSTTEGQIGRPEGQNARVLAQVIEQGRGDKVLVFHFKRKKQYKKLFGHRQPFTSVRITEISVDGQKFSAPELEKKAKPARRAAPEREPAVQAPEAAAKHEEAAAKTAHEAPHKPAAKKAAPKKAAKGKTAGKPVAKKSAAKPKGKKK